MKKLLPPSSAARRVACPGSRALEAAQPKETQESEAAIEGRHAHAYAIDLTRYTCERNQEMLKVIKDRPGLTDDIIKGGELLRDVVLQDVRPESNLLFEHALEITGVYANCEGRVDVASVDSEVIKIYDYKFGFKFVDAFENWQLLEYAVGISDSHASYSNLREIHLVIIQPRSFHPSGKVRTWILDRDKFEEYRKYLIDCEYRSLQDNAVCNPSPQCGDCRAKTVCPTLQEAALSVVDLSMQNTPFDLTPAAIGHELRYLKRAELFLKARMTGLEEEALSLIKKGKSIPYFKAESTIGRQQWTKPALEIKTLGDLMGIDLSKPTDVITPKQAIDAGLDSKLVRDFSESPRGALKLVPDESSRKIFGGGK